MTSTRTHGRGIVLVAVMALVLGIFGFAGASNAAGLTSKAVKKIAAKVVAKKAPGLSVAHADTATTASNSTKLNGAAASAFQNPFFTVGVTAAGVANFNKTLPAVPAGDYLVTMNLSASLTTSNNNFGCTLSEIGTVLLVDYTKDFGGISTVNASGAVHLDGSAMHLFCQTPAGTFTSPSGGTYPANSITFTRIDAGTNLGNAS